MTTGIDLNGKRVLVIRLSALGDVFRTIPAVLSLVHRYPNAEFFWLVENTSASLLRALPELKLIEIDRSSLRSGSPFQRTSQFLGVVKTIKDHHFDVALDYHGVLKSAIYPFLAGIPLRVGYAKGGSKEGAHRLLTHLCHMEDPFVSRHVRNLALSQWFDPSLKPVVPNFNVSEARRRELSEALSENPIVLFPGTSEHGRNKRWPTSYWAWLYRRIQASYPVRFLFGPGDEAYREALTKELGNSFVEVPAMPLLDLTSAFSFMRLLVAGDTGPMHLASILDTPLVCMMGPSDPGMNSPPQGQNRVVLANVPCSPCRNRKCKVLVCQTHTTPLRVYQTTMDLLQSLQNNCTEVGAH